ncbi:putative swi/snf-related matrix-associated actin-dependent regulator [Acrodontium crateriforme]|uniref:Swi/snf-related matrix-associated actin-dependent regulator n=1 Tax=Acrodontium crateriforme TaxID=150365 RepID=A0AAQ3LZJ4_9PEZI|nr:putative swi/snf-related matrix-associated actin-dependent regulator [Acrodontium crateriforme]
MEFEDALEWQADTFDYNVPDLTFSDPQIPTTATVNGNQPASLDPRVLLNPQSATANVPPATKISYSAPSTNYQSNHPFTAPENVEATGPGMGNLIENLHHIKKRDSGLSLKRKVDSTNPEEEQKFKKSTTTFNGSAGIISQHLSEQREDTPTIGVTRENVPIDLTEDNDDDIQFVEEKKNEEICLGIIPAKAAMSRLPAVQQMSMKSVGKGFYPRTKLSARRVSGPNKNIDLLDRNGKHCGKLTLQAAAALAPLMDGERMNKARFSFFLDAHKRGDNPSEPGNAISEILRVSVIIHAPQIKAEMIGKWLSSKQLFLLAPPENVAGRYRNPQEPQRPSNRPLNNSAIGARGIVRTEEEVLRDTTTMFDGLVSHENLAEMEADERYISTPLLKHQKQALQFMYDHEQEGVDKDTAGNDVALWKYERLRNGQDSWYHVITGHQVLEKPEWPLGGILADMMGLGKTLSLLSLVAATRAYALHFANHGPMISPEVSPVEANVKTTLIVCPKSVLANWTEQIKAHGKIGKWRTLVYHGTSRTQDLHELGKYDIIFTTYQTLANEFKGVNRALAQLRFYRVILDEAHSIRNPTSAISIACCKTEASRRWAATGTPVQNRLDDLGALFKFLSVKPFDDSKIWNEHITKRFKSADPKVIGDLRLLVDTTTIRRQRDKINLPGRRELMTNLDFSPEEQRLYTRLASGQSKKFQLMTMKHDGQLKGRSYAQMLKLILQLRMFCAHGLEMFPEETRQELLDRTDADNDVALDLGEDPTLGPLEFVTESQAYETIQVLIESDSDQCMMCGNAIGVKKKKVPLGGEDGEDSEEVPTDEEEAEDDETAAKNDEMGCLTTCLHLLCKSCQRGYISETVPTLYEDQHHKCSICDSWVRFGIYELYYSTLQGYNEIRAKKAKKKDLKYDNYPGPHTKVKALLEQLDRSRQETRALPVGEPPIRSVVFSGWTTYLDLISIALEMEGHKFVRLDGSMSIRARTAVLEEFKTNPTITVLLISIKAGGQGLNLTSASKVYMMEPQWNPGVQQQAIDRVHRLGQQRDVTITHFIMNNSVEQGILKLQKRKEDLANLSLERKKTQMEEAQQRLVDLRDLFK